MAPLAEYRRTGVGKTFKDQTSRNDVPSVRRGQMSGQLSALSSAASKKASRDEQTFLQNTRLGLNQGKMSEAGYYSTLANYYEQKLSVESDPLEQIKIQNKIFGYMESAQNAAERGARKAESAASKSANAEYRELKNALFDVKAEIFVKKLSGGQYDTPTQFLDDLNKLYETEHALYDAVANDDRFSDATRESAAVRVKDIERDNNSLSGDGDYVGLAYQNQQKDSLVFVQKEGGKFPGQIDVDFRPELKDATESGDWIKGEDNIWRQSKPLGRKDPDTGEIVINDPVSGREERIAPDDPKWTNLQGPNGTIKRSVTIYNPFNPAEKRVFMQDGEGWVGMGDIEGVKVDRPSFNPQIDVYKDRQPFQENRTSLATTPFIAGGSMFGAESIDSKTGQPVFGEGQRPKTPMELSQEGPDLVDAQFKKPTYERKKRLDGGFDYMKDGKKTSIDDYVKGMGISKDEAMKGGEDLRKSPVSLIQNAQKAATGGFQSFKSFFKNIYG